MGRPSDSAIRAYYLKLGKGGAWEVDSLDRGYARVGWDSTSLDDILQGRWGRIQRALRREKARKKGGDRNAAARVGAATADYRALRRFCESGPEDIWVTFAQSRMWWGRLQPGPIERDAISKFRRVVDGWSDKSRSGETLLVNRLPGVLSRMQGYRATLCSVKRPDVLQRVLAGEPSPEAVALDRAVAALRAEVERALRGLHWKDFELLVDLVFRQSGWRRLSVAGENMAWVDLELQESVTGETYQVQVKSMATRAEAEKCRAWFRPGPVRRYYFVVHSPAEGLDTSLDTDCFEVVLPDRLSRMVVDAGLTGWLRDRLA